MEEFSLQEEEVAGLVKVRWEDFCQLWAGKQDLLPILQSNITNPLQKGELKTSVTRESFVPHPPSFYQDVIRMIQPFIINKGEI